MTFSTDTLFLTDEIEGFKFCRETRSVNAMTIIICEAGYIDVVLNGQNVRIGKDDIFIRIPTYGQELGPYQYSPDYKFRQLTVSKSIYEEIMFSYMRTEPRWWQKQEYLRLHPVFHLNDLSKQFCMAYHNLVCLELAQPQTDYRRQIEQLLGRAGITEIMLYLDHVIGDDAMPRESVNSSDYIFHQFMTMLHEHPHQREVQWFASELNITPKYLSEISKARSGKSASEWIAEITVAEITHLLRHTTASIHDVAVELEFPNTSFFCQYTKKHTGMTPNHFRKQKKD